MSLRARAPRSLKSFCCLTNDECFAVSVSRGGRRCRRRARAPVGYVRSMALGASDAVRARRRQELRGRRGRAAARKRAHLRDREVQRAQARRRLRNPYDYIAERSGARLSATGKPPAPLFAQPRKTNFREVQNVVGPPQAYQLRALTGEMRRHLRGPK